MYDACRSGNIEELKVQRNLLDTECANIAGHNNQLEIIRLLATMNIFPDENEMTNICFRGIYLYYNFLLSLANFQLLKVQTVLVV